MPLVQGSNVPLTIKFDSSVENLSKLVVTLWSDIRANGPLKQWEKADMTISGDTVICPLTEDETKSFPKTILVVEIKALDGNGDTAFWQEVPIKVVPRRDKIITLTDGG